MSYPSLPKTQRTYQHPIWPHKIKYSAFTAGQQSLLLQVADADVPFEERLDTMAQIFTQCVDAGAPFSALPLALVEKVFLLMREISVGDVLKLRYECNHETDDAANPGAKIKCGQALVLPVDLKQVDIITPEGFNTDYELSPGFWIRMKLPTYGKAVKLKDTQDIQSLFAAFTECIYTEEESWPVADPDEDGIALDEKQRRTTALDEFRDWVADNIDSVMIKTITEGFFNKMPTINFDSSIKCPKCGTIHPVKFNSLSQIFI